MSVTTCTQATFIVDSEGEKSPAWPDGSIVNCRDSGRTYVLRSGRFVVIYDPDAVYDLERRFRLLLRGYVRLGFPIPRGLETESVIASTQP